MSQSNRNQPNDASWMRPHSGTLWHICKDVIFCKNDKYFVHSHIKNRMWWLGRNHSVLHARFTAYMKWMPQPYFEMEESRSVTPWVNRLYFESPRASSFLGLRLVKTRHKNLVPLLYGVKPDPMVGSGRYAKPIPVKSPMEILQGSAQHTARPDHGVSFDLG